MPYKDPAKRKAAVRAAKAKRKAQDPEQYRLDRAAEARDRRAKVAEIKVEAIRVGRWTPRAEKILQDILRLSDEVSAENSSLNDSTGDPYRIWTETEQRRHSEVGRKLAQLTEMVFGENGTEKGHGSDGGMGRGEPLSDGDDSGRRDDTSRLIEAESARAEGIAITVSTISHPDDVDDVPDGIAGKRTVLADDERERLRIKPNEKLRVISRTRYSKKGRKRGRRVWIGVHDKNRPKEAGSRLAGRRENQSDIRDEIVGLCDRRRDLAHYLYRPDGKERSQPDWTTLRVALELDRAWRAPKKIIDLGPGWLRPRHLAETLRWLLDPENGWPALDQALMNLTYDGVLEAQPDPGIVVHGSKGWGNQLKVYRLFPMNREEGIA